MVKMIKIGKHILGVALAIALLSMTPSCSREPDYKSTREVVQDVETGMSYEVIRNPSEPLYGEKGSAEKVLEIGDPGLTEGADENYIFAYIRDVSFRDDTIYVADKLEESIRVFDSDGVYQRAIGGKGQGPGEFSWIRNIYVDDDGFVYAYERNGSLHIFNNDYEFLRKRNIKSLVKGLTEINDIASIDPENFLLHCSFRYPMSIPGVTDMHSNENEDLFVRLNKDGEWFSFGPSRGYPGFEKSIESLKRATPPGGSMDYNIYFSMLLSHKNMFLDQEDKLLYSSTKAFPPRVVVHSSDDGRILRIIERGSAKNEPFYITQKVDFKESFNTPEIPFHMTDKLTKHYYFREEGMGIFADDANIYNVYKRRSMEGDSLRVQYFMDIFDLSGTYKQRVPLNMEIGSNFGGMDDGGNVVVFRRDPWPVIEKYQLIGLGKNKKKKK